MLNAAAWMDAWCAAVRAAFGERICFLGLQGSYGRDEADGESDIDPLLILDHWTAADAIKYRAVLAGLPESAKCCGFAGGAAEIAAWDRADLFQLVRDTTPLQGDLTALVPPTGDKDARRAAHREACALYHGLTHHLVHGSSPRHVPGALKNAVYVLQAKLFIQTGLYLRRHEQVLRVAAGEDRWVAEMAQTWKHRAMPPEVEEVIAPRLLAWLSGIICEAAIRP